MEACLLATSPNWYCSRVADCNENGLLVFGAKHSLQFLDVTQDPPQFVGQLKVHGDRVVGVSLCQVSGHTHMCATTGEDGQVKMWDLTKKTLLQEHAQHKVCRFLCSPQLTFVSICAMQFVSSICCRVSPRRCTGHQQTRTWWSAGTTRARSPSGDSKLTR